ncbi:MAG: galactokinase [Bacteroidota bacterium]
MRRKVKVQAPGRINLIGEHTDYNGGLVLPAATDKVFQFEITRNDSVDQVQVVARDIPDTFSFSLSVASAEVEGWPRYIYGVCRLLLEQGATLSGFDASFSSSIPIGAGMSSSAALACGFAQGLNELFELGLDRWEIIEIAQKTEHQYVGLQCGIMDQFASMMGKEGQVVQLNCGDRSFEYVPIVTGDYRLLLLNTGVSHNLAESAYNQRKEECTRGLTLLQKHIPNAKTLGDLASTQVQAFAADLPEAVYQRCWHVTTENERVKAAVEAIQQHDLERLGELLFASHNSLRDDYAVSCRELDFLVEQAEIHPGVIGARMMGGGFGGCTINLVHKDQLDRFTNQVTGAYHKQFGIDLHAYPVHISDGAKMIAYE